MKLTLLTTAFAASFAFVTCTTKAADDFVARARVIEVIALTEEAPPVVETCQIAKPPGRDLVALLRWDLCTQPVPKPKPRGYRVRYEWDDHVYERVVSKRPGATVPLRIVLE